MLIFFLLPLYFAMLVSLHAGAAKVAALVFRRITLPWRKAAILGLACVTIQLSCFIFGAAGPFVAIAVALVLPPIGAAWYWSSQTLTRSGEPVSFGLGLLHSFLAWFIANAVVLTVVLSLFPPFFEGGG